MPDPIPSFALYGEDRAASPRIFAHIETIAARSSLHDWEIAPHRHADFVQILLVESGQADIALDGTQQACWAPFAVIAPPHAVHGFRFAPDTEGYVLTLSSDFVTRAQGPDDPLQRLFGQGGIAEFQTAAARTLLLLAREMLGQLVLRPDDTGLHLALAEAIARLLAALAEPGTAPSADPRIARFRALVERHFREHRGLDFYAAQLGTTRRTLARLTAARLGASPKQVIDQRLAAEARRLLHYTNAGAAQVAAELGFDDPSWFSRFYLRTTGRRPRMDKRAPSAA
ncbi:helix-turn-helix domain-containing protein [Novosphingobium sp.]|uniref:helix-turn-helix domain-containing protein n=1 Tax=Novosphingobium sp. TaxID=1874826 RepID=UPI002600D648|nr:helix-turn-helix domain-containing protein [Novosphingobium sp.]